jgi:hypothetical protein
MSAFDFIFDYVGAMREERHGDIPFIADNSEILFEEFACGVTKES